MIGVKKRVLIFAVGTLIVPMINPVILKKEKQVFTGFTAQVIQHEMNHFEGIII